MERPDAVGARRSRSLSGALESGRMDGWTAAAVALLALSLAIRVALAYPVHAYAGDADSSLTGLSAFRVLRGETPVFFSHYRIGAIGGYLTAGLFLAGGVSRATLALAPVVWGFLLTVVWALFARQVLERRLAVVALAFIAVPSPALLFWAGMPNGYPEVVMLSAAILWAAGRAAGAERGGAFLLLGTVIGLGFWTSLQTVGCALPACLWLGWERRRSWPPLAHLGLAVAGFAAGASPWLAFNLRYGFPSLKSELVAKANGAGEILASLRALLTSSLPELIAPRESGWPAETAWMLSLRAPVLALHVVALGVFFVAVSGRRAPAWVGRRRPALVVALLVATLLALNAVSSLAARFLWPVRYVLPIYLVVPLVLAVGLGAVARLSKPLAATLGVALLGFNFLGLRLPWTAERAYLEGRLAVRGELLGELERQGVEAVLGDFWQVYALNFDSRERIAAIPWDPEQDHYAIERRLGPEVRRWAIVRSDGEARLQPAWIEDAGLVGDLGEAAGFQVFVFDHPGAPRALLERLRRHPPPSRR